MAIDCLQWAHVLKKVESAGSCNFLPDSCKLLTEIITSARNFDFAPKWGSWAQNFVCFKVNVVYKKKVFRKVKI